MRPLGFQGKRCLGFLSLVALLGAAPLAPGSEPNATGPSPRAAIEPISADPALVAAEEPLQPALRSTPNDPASRDCRTLPTASLAAPTSAKRAKHNRGADLFREVADGSALTAAAALAFVVGLFMLLAWAMKRSMPKGSQLLPAEAVRILGRVPLGARQFGHLLQLGNKLVLVNVSQAGVEKLAEIDDREEVMRLLGICSSSGGKGSQREFEEIFGQFAKEPAEPGFLGSETSLFSDTGKSGGRRYA